ncbi:Geraniol 8-hydroxylase [Camellia lanceoleosa]|uniref:Geraniol 8-hydroxylase n=1 Tax=Camellia lanceoleosa TaxID=1840588 RepID=A0ACC0I8M6_9ERIC|nr:Geraniol 8-hydroxylase [Camellia lanceoleosa]
MISVMLGSLLNSLDWKLDGGIKPEDLDMEEKFGMILQKGQPPFLRSGVDNVHFSSLLFGSSIVCIKRMVLVVLGLLINLFDWKSEGGIELESLHMEEKFSIAPYRRRNQPLLVIPTQG